jgi:hypothetical protein
MIHIYAHLERLINGFRAIYREQWAQFLGRQRMLAANTLNWRNQKFGIGLDRKAYQTGDIGSFLSDGDGPHEPGFRID